MKKLNTDIKYLILIWTVLFIGLILTFAHHGHILVDCGREVYYPTQILLGKVLYKDIFNIYGPFSYMFNALLFKTFGIHLNVLYLSGCTCAFLIVNLVYLIAKRFLGKFLSFSVAVFTISIGVLNLWLFNFVFPYSYAILYGLVSFLTSVWLLLKYQEFPEKNIYLYLSSFFAGVCIANKYEFLPYLIVILYTTLKVKPLKFKQCYYTIFSLLFVPVFSFGILFLQGLRMNDIVSTALILNKMAHTQTLKYFYTTQGVFFNKNTISFLIYNFFKTIIPLAFFLYGFNLKKRYLSILTIALSTGLIFYWNSPVALAFLPLLVVILAIVDFKRIKENPPLAILTLSCITFCSKILWGLITTTYGAFFASFLLITALALIFDVFRKNKINSIAVGAYILAFSMILGYNNFYAINTSNHLISTNKGRIYSDKALASASNELINYIKKNTKKTDKIVIFPEGEMINFLSERPTDNFYNSLIPLYVETFGEEKLIEHFEKTKPEYIIFDNWNTSDYGPSYICSDYAASFCNYVAENYSQEKVIDKGFRYLIFKKK